MNRGLWSDGSETAGVDDGVRMSGHGGQTARILILASLIFYPPLNAPRTLGAGSGELVLSSGGHGHLRKRKRGFVDGRWF